MWILEHVAGASGYTLVAYAAGATYAIVKVANYFLSPGNSSNKFGRAQRSATSDVVQHQHSNNYFDTVLNFIRSCLPTWLGAHLVSVPQRSGSYRQPQPLASPATSNRQIPNPALLQAAMNQHREDEAEKGQLRIRVKELEAAEAERSKKYADPPSTSGTRPIFSKERESLTNDGIKLPLLG